jgi:hypothetical protein
MPRIRHSVRGLEIDPGPADPDDLDERIAAGSDRYRRLPARIAAQDMIAEQAVEPARDPEGGRNTDQDFMLRYN